MKNRWNPCEAHQRSPALRPEPEEVKAKDIFLQSGVPEKKNVVGSFSVFFLVFFFVKKKAGDTQCRVFFLQLYHVYNLYNCIICVFI